MEDLNIVLKNAEIFALKEISKFPDTIVYHDMIFTERFLGYIEMISEKISLAPNDILLAKITGWLYVSSFRDQKISFSSDEEIESNIKSNALLNSDIFFKDNKIDQVLQDQIIASFPELFSLETPITELGKVLADALTIDFIYENGKKHLKQQYQELLLHDVHISRKKWLDMAVKLSHSFSFHLPFCKEFLDPKLNQLRKDLEKEKKQHSKTIDLALKTELGIRDEELKKLKKNLDESKGRDARGIQTIFRTTSKNHYTMSAMVDRKARIMITINSIILSLVLGGVIGKDFDGGLVAWSPKIVPVLLLTITSIVSIVFAILSIRPEVTHGEFTEDDVRNKEGNLLYYGNFHNMQFRDFEWGFLQMMNDQEYLYSSMIKDIYFLGLHLKRKYAYIRISLTAFLFGIVSSVLVFFTLIILNL